MKLIRSIKTNIAFFFGIEKRGAGTRSQSVAGVDGIAKQWIAKPTSAAPLSTPSMAPAVSFKPPPAPINRVHPAVEAERNRVREIMRVGFQVGRPRMAAALIEQGVGKNSAIHILQSAELDTKKKFYNRAVRRTIPNEEANESNHRNE